MDLKKSLSSIKFNETKGRKKSLPKLKTILANPYNEKCLELNEDELSQLERLLCAAISTTSEKPQIFATSKHIRLGLESSLRAINNKQCSCVIISLSIKPRYLVRLIARNSRNKDASVAVFAQTELEKFTERVFGIHALAMVLPTITEMKRVNLSEELIKWVQSRQKPAKVKIVKAIKLEKAVKKQKIKSEPTHEAIETKQELKVEEKATNENDDFISFSAVSKKSFIDDTEEDVRNLEAALTSKLLKAGCAQQTQVQNEDTVAFRVTKMKETYGTEKEEKEMFSDSDDFLPAVEYQPLVVHKIQPNPQKRPKKKRNKNKERKK